MNKYLIKQMIKAAKIPAIIGGVSLLVGLILLIVGLVTLTEALVWIGCALLLVAFLAIVWAIASINEVKDAICPSCHKYMGESDEEVAYEFSIAQVDRRYDKSGKFIGYQFSYNYSITCPHCGNAAMRTCKLTNKNEADANVQMEKRIKAILRVKHRGK